MQKRISQPARLTGSRGLIGAIIHRALLDAIRADPETLRDAWAYFGGDEYQAHMEHLGLPPDIWPAALSSLDDDEFLRISDRILGS